MSRVNDRRGSSDRASGNRQRFIERNKDRMRKAVRDKLSDSNITDVGDGGKDVYIPEDEISEPSISHGQGGTRERVMPGNDRFDEGDRIPKPPGGGSGSGPGDPSQDGDGEDDFVFHLTRDEVLDILFEDMELPNLEETQEADTNLTSPKNAGYTSEGADSKLDRRLSKKNRKARVHALTKDIKEEIEQLLIQKKNILKQYKDGVDAGQRKSGSGINKNKTLKQRIEDLEKITHKLYKQFRHELSNEDAQNIREIDRQLAELNKKHARKAQWRDDDLRYKFTKQQPQPSTQAVMFCLMDVSASMDQEAKDNAKRFKLLLYEMLRRKYDNVHIVFIRHTNQAEEVEEKEYFYGTKTGGTCVSQGLEKVKEIQEERYPPEKWNIFVTHASDGDNPPNDKPNCEQVMSHLMSRVRAFFYPEVANQMQRSGRTAFRGLDTELSSVYKSIKAQYPNRLFTGRIEDKKDVWPLLEKFFKKKDPQNQPAQKAEPA
jgi:hypothetical protein